MRAKIYSQEEFIKVKGEAETLKLGFEDISDHIIITDKDSVILYANKAVELRTGFKRDEVIGKTPGELWGNQMGKDFYKKMWQTIGIEKKPFVGTVKNKRQDGTVYWAELRIYPILDNVKNIKFFIGIEPDITEQVEEGAKKEEFLSLISHQLKSPLAIERILLEDLIQESPLAQKQKIKDILESNQEISELISNLLIISRIKKSEINPETKNFSLKEILEKIIQDLTPLILKKKLTIIFGCSHDIEIKTGYIVLRQIFENIIINAINYSYDSGKININLEKTKEGTLFVCKDNGIGISADDQKYIFNYFFRAANAAKIKSGTGLGLYIVKLLTDIIGGRVWFESEENKGAIFFVFIPIHKKNAERSNPFQPGVDDRDYQKYAIGGFSKS